VIAVIQKKDQESTEKWHSRDNYMQHLRDNSVPFIAMHISSVITDMLKKRI